MKDMMQAKKHIDALKMMAESKGMALEDFIEQVVGEEEMEGEEEMGMEGEEGMGGEEPKKSMPNKAKIALIIAKMKNGKKE